MSARSQRALRYRQGYDSSGDTAYMYGERSMLTPQQQCLAANAVGFFPDAPPGIVFPTPTGAEPFPNFIVVTPYPGYVLTITSNGVWTPGVGCPILSYTYEWLADGVPVSASKTATYTATVNDLGKRIHAVEYVQTAYGFHKGKATPISGIVTVSGPPTLISPIGIEHIVAIVGTSIPTIGAQFVAVPSASPVNQWFKDGVVIAGATGTSYNPIAGSVGGILTIKSTINNGVGAPLVVESNPTLAVVSTAPAASAPVVTVQPFIRVTPKVGAFNSVFVGAYSGYPKPTTTQQWYRDGVLIPGATSSYKPVAEDVGTILTVTLTRTNPSGSASATTPPPAPCLPA